MTGVIGSELPVDEEAESLVFSLPIFTDLTNAEVCGMVTTIKEF